VFTNEQQETVWGPRALIRQWVFKPMRRLGLTGQVLANRIGRRTDWFLYQLTLRRIINTLTAAAQYFLKHERAAALPVFVIIDISPLCNLHCTVCLHAYPNGNPDLEKQEFHGRQLMSVEQYRRIIDQIKDYSIGVLLYYIGDPIVPPDLERLCAVTHEAGLVSHVSTNFSLPLSAERIRRLVTSGLTHLTVCVDGLAQETYARTRVGGRLDRVMGNLERVCACRRALRRRYPRVEVQYIKYRHNLDQLEEARRTFYALGVDQVHHLWGWLHNYTDRDPGKFSVFGPQRNAWRPRCHWTHLFTLVKYDGDVLPCCAFRLGHQYTSRDDPRAVGNVFTDRLRDVWNNAEYRRARRLACNPEAIRDDPTLAESFCDACPRLFETDFVERTCRYGSEYDYDDFYIIGPDGLPIRRRDALEQTSPRATLAPGEAGTHSDPP
jgi:MoaA/NifB/PqqE/SkfB family radical SAM enzyme